jgi:hypothetical protein
VQSDGPVKRQPPRSSDPGIPVVHGREDVNPSALPPWTWYVRSQGLPSLAENTAKRLECKRQRLIKIGNIREKTGSSEHESITGEIRPIGLQSPVHRLNSGRRLQESAWSGGCFGPGSLAASSGPQVG